MTVSSGKSDYEIVGGRLASDSGKIPYAFPEVDGGCGLFACGNNVVKTLAVRCGIILSAAGVCVRSDDKVSVNGGRNKNAFSERAGALEHYVTEKFALRFIEKVILASGRIDGKAFVTDHVCNGVAVNACSIDNEFRFDFFAVFAGDDEVPVFFSDGRNFPAKFKFNPVFNRLV